VVNAAQRNFGRRLRDQRERAQIALSEIAETTKIKRSLLEELERGDVSLWPGGIFRRAFLRAYASAIGLPPEAVVEEFTQVFPLGDSVATKEAKQELRLTLVVDPWRCTAAAVSNAIVALIEAGVIVALAVLTAWITAANVWAVCAVIALTYYAAGAACLGCSPASWLLQHGLPAFRPRRPAVSSPSARARDLLHLVQRRERPDEPSQDLDDSTAPPTPLRAASH